MQRTKNGRSAAGHSLLPRSMINGVLLLSALFVRTNAALLYALDAPDVGTAEPSDPGIDSVCVAHRVRDEPRRLGIDADRLRSRRRHAHGGHASEQCGRRRAIAHGVVRPRPCGDRILYLSKYLLSYVAVFTLRHREPSTPRPY
jgi:hypothetical protein